MAQHLKSARSESDRREDDAKVRQIVTDILADIEARGDAAVRELAKKFDNQEAETFLMSDADIEATIAKVAPQEFEDIRFAQEQVRNFARVQKDALRDVEVETLPGVVLGHKNVPVNSVGCYVPGGKYPMVASAHMSVATADVAGREAHRRLSAAAARRPAQPRHHRGDASWRRERDLRPGRRAGGRRDGARHRDDRPSGTCSSVRATPSSPRRSASSTGRVGIDLFAGPTETMVIADETVDAEMCATDLLGQAEHGPTSPAVLLTTSDRLARETMQEVDRLLAILPTAEVARQAWADYGEVIVCEDHEEMLKVANGDRVGARPGDDRP